MAARVHVDDVDGVHAVKKLLHRQRRVGVDHAGVEPAAQHGGHAVFGAAGLALPLMVGVPGRGFADGARVLVDGRVDIGRAGLDAGFEHGHVDEGMAHVDDDLGTGLLNEFARGRRVHGVERVRFQHALGVLQNPFFVNVINQCQALADGARGNVDVTQLKVVLRALVRHYLPNSTSANDQNVLLHVAQILLLISTATLRQTGIDLKTGCPRSRRTRTTAPTPRARPGAQRRWTACARR